MNTMNEVLRTLREGSLRQFRDDQIEQMMQICHQHIQSQQPLAPPALQTLLSEFLARRIVNLAQRTTTLSNQMNTVSEQMDRLVGVANEFNAATVRIERQTHKVIRLTRALMLLTVAIIVLALMLLAKEMFPGHL
jgi:hypothetical protein